MHRAIGSGSVVEVKLLDTRKVCCGKKVKSLDNKIRGQLSSPLFHVLFWWFLGRAALLLKLLLLLLLLFLFIYCVRFLLLSFSFFGGQICMGRD